MKYRYHISEYPAWIKERIDEVENHEHQLEVMHDAMVELQSVARSLRVNETCSDTVINKIDAAEAELEKVYKRANSQYRQVFSEVYPLVRREDIRRMINEDEAFIRGEAS